MGIEQKIGDLVAAADSLTTAVNGKVSQIDKRMDVARAEFDEFRSKKDLVGAVGASGSVQLNVFQGSVWGTGGPQSTGASGEFSVVDLGTSANVYMHFKLPVNVNTHDQMFWLNIRGYSYGSASIVDETIVGYCYSPQRAVLNKAVFGSMSPGVYTDTSGNVIMCLKFPSVYVTTIRVDTMQVGVGGLFAVGSIKSKLSLADKVEF
ncbi:hypothetical protein HBO34_02570 [Pseudomonas veronii]|uniref:hypothetical protein n=1 Tax=Pseudomonas veronii TaxID=76761 RepID=UPI001472F074|nr:hypothetical protein [Pseudomonas veronii]NMX36754.1 hypothetical protein [Pseudomonas veronii]WKC45751.1 hypothetical protein QYP03_23440 [Pseudomonas veronii]